MLTTPIDHLGLDIAWISPRPTGDGVLVLAPDAVVTVPGSWLLATLMEGHLSPFMTFSWPPVPESGSDWPDGTPVGRIYGHELRVSGLSVRLIARVLAERLGAHTDGANVWLSVASLHRHRGSPWFYNLLDPETRPARIREGFMGKVGPVTILVGPD